MIYLQIKKRLTRQFVIARHYTYNDIHHIADRLLLKTPLTSLSIINEYFQGMSSPSKKIFKICQENVRHRRIQPS